MARRIVNPESISSAAPAMDAAARLAAAKAELEAARAAAKAAREAAKAAAREAAAAAKAARPQGAIESLADVIKELCSRPQGADKAEILDAWLARRGIAPDTDGAIKAAATLGAQLGARIAPRLAARGISLRLERALGAKQGRYFAAPLEAAN